MGTPRGGAEETRARILAAARELFAERGIKVVTVREIAASAGVNHALVHRYFGTKQEMAAEIIRREIDAVVRVGPTPAGPPAEGLDVLRRLIRFGLTEGQTTMRLIARAEFAGLEPEKMLPHDPRLLSMLAAWIAAQRPERPGAVTNGPDPAIVSLVVGAALFSFATVTPWLMTAVGLSPDDFDQRRDEIADLLVDIVARAVEAPPAD
jgi:AcrR family transcriptional regulator